MHRMFLNLIFIFAFSSALISQESKPANKNSTSSPAPGSASATPGAQASPAKAAEPSQPAGAARSTPPAAGKVPMKETEEDEVGTPKAAAKPAPALPATTPVITLNFCKGAAASKTKTAATKAPEAANCKIAITKAEFDKVLDAAVPRNRRPPGGDIPQQVKQAIAKEYLNIYIMAREAEKRGFPAKDPTTQEMLKLSRMQVLSVALNQELQEKAKPTDAQVAQYYKDNPSAFVEVSLRRLYVPKPPQTPPAPTSTNAGANAPNATGANAGNATGANTNGPGASAANAAANTPKLDPEAQKAALEAQRTAAEKLRARATAGEDMDKLEKEAFEAISSKQTPPQTQMGNRRRGIMPPDQDTEIFSLEPGQVSKLFENPGGWYVFKVESKRTIPFKEATEEIQRKLQPENFKDVHDGIIAGVKSDLNEKYFGPAAPAAGAVGKTQPTPPPARPSSTRPQATSSVPKAADSTH